MFLDILPKNQTSGRAIMLRDTLWNFDITHLGITQLTTQTLLFFLMLRILTGKKHPKNKLQRLQKVQIWTFRSLVHQINSF